MKSDPSFWIAARASGLTAYVVVTCSVLAGLVLKSRPLGTLLRPKAVTETHRMLALMALIATTVHGAALLLDPTLHLRWYGLFAPGYVPYRPVWTGVGVAGAELMVLVYASFSMRKRIGVANWRRLHWVTYGLFAAFTAHGLLAGSDSGRPWAIDIYVAAVAAVVTATIFRALVQPVPARKRTAARATTSRA